MTGFSICYTDGSYTNFPGAIREQADTVTSWYRTAPDSAVLVLNLPDTGKTIYADRRHITRIEVYV